jgi:hypothetical protein
LYKTGFEAIEILTGELGELTGEALSDLTGFGIQQSDASLTRAGLVTRGLGDRRSGWRLACSIEERQQLFFWLVEVSW